MFGLAAADDREEAVEEGAGDLRSAAVEGAHVLVSAAGERDLHWAVRRRIRRR